MEKSPSVLRNLEIFFHQYLEISGRLRDFVGREELRKV